MMKIFEIQAHANINKDGIIHIAPFIFFPWFHRMYRIGKESRISGAKKDDYYNGYRGGRPKYSGKCGD